MLVRHQVASKSLRTGPAQFWPSPWILMARSFEPAIKRLRVMAEAFGRPVESPPKSVPANTEGGQTADGRWNRPTNFRHLIGDLLGMRNLRRSWHLAPGADPMGCGTAAHIARSPGELPSRSPKMERRRSEGGTATVGRWNPPKDFGPLIGDLLDMRNSAPMRRPQPSGAIGGRLWPPPHEGTVALEEMGS